MMPHSPPTSNRGGEVLNGEDLNVWVCHNYAFWRLSIYLYTWHHLSGELFFETSFPLFVYTNHDLCENNLLKISSYFFEVFPILSLEF